MYTVRDCPGAVPDRCIWPTACSLQTISNWPMTSFQRLPSITVPVPTQWNTGGASALDAMNAWVSHHTGGRIEEVPIEPTPATRLNLINTVYFAAAWAEPFAAEDTEEGSFFTNSGRVQAPMMRSVQSLRHMEGTGWQGRRLAAGQSQPHYARAHQR